MSVSVRTAQAGAAERRAQPDAHAGALQRATRVRSASVDRAAYWSRWRRRLRLRRRERKRSGTPLDGSQHVREPAAARSRASQSQSQSRRLALAMCARGDVARTAPPAGRHIARVAARRRWRWRQSHAAVHTATSSLRPRCRRRGPHVISSAVMIDVALIVQNIRYAESQATPLVIRMKSSKKS